MKKIITSIMTFIIMMMVLGINVYSIENQAENTTSGSIVAIVNGKVIKTNSINENQYILSVETDDGVIKFENEVSNYLELLDINKNKVLLRDSIKANTAYYMLNLNDNKLEELNDIHKTFESNVNEEVSKNKERLYKVTYYEHFLDDSGVIWFRYAVTLIGEENLYIVSGIGNSKGKYYRTGVNGTIVNFTKGHEDSFYAVNVDETPSGNIMKNTASLLKITRDFTVKSYDLQYSETLKDSKIEVTSDNLIYLLPALYKDDQYLYSLKCYKLNNSLEVVSNFPSLKEKILDVSKDNDGNLYVLLQGKIDKINKNSFESFADVDSEKNYLQVYDEKNYLVSNMYLDKESNKSTFSYSYVLDEDLNKEINNIEEETKKVLTYSKSSINKDSNNTIELKNLGNNLQLKFDPASMSNGKGKLNINGSDFTFEISLSPIIIKNYDVGDYISIEISISNLPIGLKNKYEAVDKLYSFKVALRDSKNEIVKDYSSLFKDSNIKTVISEGFIDNTKKIGILNVDSIETGSCEVQGEIAENSNSVEFTVKSLGKFIIGEAGEDNKLVSKKKDVTVSSETVLNGAAESYNDMRITSYIGIVLTAFGCVITILVITWAIRRNKV